MSVSRYTLFAILGFCLIAAAGCGSADQVNQVSQPSQSNNETDQFVAEAETPSPTIEPQGPTKSLSGFWKVTQFEPAGHEAELGSVQIFAEGQHFIYRPATGQLEQSAQVILDTQLSPAHITLTAIEEVEGVDPWPGVFHATDNSVVIRMGEIGGRRPLKLNGTGGVLIVAERTTAPVANSPVQDWTVGPETIQGRVVAYGREEFGVLLETGSGDLRFARYDQLALADKQRLDTEYGLALAAPREFQVDPAAEATALDSLREAIPAEEDVAVGPSGGVVQARLVSHTFDDNHFAAIAKLSHLESLSISAHHRELGESSEAGKPITSTGLEQLRRLRNLEDLTLNATQIDLTGLTHLSALEQLNVLRIRSPKPLDSEVRLTGEAVKHLTNISNLEDLQLLDIHMEPDCLTPLDRMISLHSLTLRPCGDFELGEKTLNALAYCEPLRDLTVSVSTAEEAAKLALCKQLETLTVELPKGAAGVEEAKQNLVKALPRTKVEVHVSAQ